MSIQSEISILLIAAAILVILEITLRRKSARKHESDRCLHCEAPHSWGLWKWRAGSYRPITLIGTCPWCLQDSEYLLDEMVRL